MFGLAVLTSISVVPSDINRLTNRPENISHSAYQENRGQWPANVRYLLQKPGLNYWITDRGVRFDFHRTELIQAESDGRPRYHGQSATLLMLSFLLPPELQRLSTARLCLLLPTTYGETRTKALRGLRALVK